MYSFTPTPFPHMHTHSAISNPMVTKSSTGASARDGNEVTSDTEGTHEGLTIDGVLQAGIPNIRFLPTSPATTPATTDSVNAAANATNSAAAQAAASKTAVPHAAPSDDIAPSSTTKARTSSIATDDMLGALRFSVFTVLHAMCCTCTCIPFTILTIHSVLLSLLFLFFPCYRLATHY